MRICHEGPVRTGVVLCGNCYFHLSVMYVHTCSGPHVATSPNSRNLSYNRVLLLVMIDCCVCM